ncbi:DUF397 domain-containing protein [Actinomadura fulvescens]|uniref:DUF397 domain-containing protein n=1 Tax=Actinomadura fulvescens TaxID=46160 RepID=A0ABP6CNT2_9ACTN
MSKDKTAVSGYRKSSFSGGVNDACVEVKITNDAVMMRDSKDPAGPALSFTHEEWEAFLLGVKDEQFELPEG